MRLPLALTLTCLLAACGGGTTAGGSPEGVSHPASAPAPARGSLLGNATAVPVAVSNGVSLGTVPPNVMAGFLGAAQNGTVAVAGAPKCSVAIYRVHYNTVGSAGEATDASAAVMVPSGSGESCSNSRPVLLYAHGTSLQKSYDMADIAGNGDPTVPYFNTTSALAYYRAQGAAVTELNIDSSLDGVNDFFRLPKLGFATAKAALRAAEGGDAIAASYHAGLVAPFCMAATRDWFQSILSR